MATSNSRLAVQMYEDLRAVHGWGPADAWKGIAMLLLTCQRFVGGWNDFHDIVVYREANDFKLMMNGDPNATMRRAEQLTSFLANELGVARQDLCGTIAQFWRNAVVSQSQPHNLVGHAFRSIVGHILSCYGAGGITYVEEVDPRELFPGSPMHLRSEDARIDLVAFRGHAPVAMITCRWRFRHDRADVPQEAQAYKAAAMMTGSNCKFYAVLGEFDPARLYKVLEHTQGIAHNPTIDGTVHFKPELVTDPAALGVNGRASALKPLNWLAQQSFTW
jgi:hypothetical protein